MDAVSSGGKAAKRSRRRLTVAVKDSLRELGTQLALLNHQVGAHIDLKGTDIECLNLIGMHGPLSPGALARRSGLHPATVTGILDRLERGRWIVRQRDPADRRGVLVRVVRDRGAEMFQLYSGMNTSMDEILARYGDDQLELIADFLGQTAQAGQGAADNLTDGR